MGELVQQQEDQRPERSGYIHVESMEVWEPLPENLIKGSRRESGDGRN